MGNFNWKKQYVLKQRFLADPQFAEIPEGPGIYLWRRYDNSITYFYVGQAKNLKNRRFNYYALMCGLGYPTRHFEASLKKHKDWHYKVIEQCPEDKLDEREKYWIDFYNAQPNHITRNTAIADQDIVQSNTKRIHKVIEKYEKEFNILLSRVSMVFSNDKIEIVVKRNKDGSLNKLSKNAFDEITNKFRKIKEVNNENEEK